MRPVNKGYSPNLYEKYGDAKDDLINRIGQFCSYCERSVPKSNLAIEHVIPKKPYPDYELEWENFLLACTNCNSIKGDRGITPDNLSDYLLPHIDNTFKYLEYDNNGVVKPKNGIPETFSQKASNIIELVGLNRVPGHSNFSNKDDRWYKRKEVWESANDFKKVFSNPNSNKDEIIKLIKSYVSHSTCPGVWSIFMSIFSDIYEVRSFLINNFKVSSIAFNDKLEPIDTI